MFVIRNRVIVSSASVMRIEVDSHTPHVIGRTSLLNKKLFSSFARVEGLTVSNVFG